MKTGEIPSHFPGMKQKDWAWMNIIDLPNMDWPFFPRELNTCCIFLGHTIKIKKTNLLLDLSSQTSFKRICWGRWSLGAPAGDAPGFGFQRNLCGRWWFSLLPGGAPQNGSPSWFLGCSHSFTDAHASFICALAFGKDCRAHFQTETLHENKDGKSQNSQKS